MSQDVLRTLGPFPVRRTLARNNVVEMADGKTFDINSARPCVFKPLDAIRRKDQVKVEGAVLELNKILASPDLFILGFIQFETKLMECGYERVAILTLLVDIRSASCVVSGNPSRIAPDFPRNKYRTRCSAKIRWIS